MAAAVESAAITSNSYSISSASNAASADAARVVLVLTGDDADAHAAVTAALVHGGLHVLPVRLSDLPANSSGAGPAVPIPIPEFDNKRRIALLVSVAPPLLAHLWSMQETEEGVPHAQAAVLSEADKVRLLASYITTAKYYHGLGIRVGASVREVTAANKNLDPKWHWVGGDCVSDLIVLDDTNFETKWLNAWSTKYLLGIDDLDGIRKNMGEQIAYHFAFIQFYLQGLIPLAFVGFFAYFVFKPYSHLYSTFLGLWSVVLIVGWKRQQVWLASKWGVSEAHKSDHERPEFLPDRVDFDEVSGEAIPYYPFWKRWIVHAGYTIPMVLTFGAAVTFVSAVILFAEVYTSEVYDGPDAFFVKLIPNVIYAACLPLLQFLYNTLSRKITDLENSQSVDKHVASLTNKTFVITLLLTQLPLILTGVFFVPLSDLLLPYLLPSISKHGLTQGKVADISRNLLSPASLEQKVVSFAITSQIINQLTETVVPAAIAWLSTFKIKVSEQTKADDLNQALDEPVPAGKTITEEVTKEEELRLRIEKAIALPVYDIYDDYAELANQFALVVMFSSSWPLASLFCLVNNFLDMRSHAFKICETVRRPIPHRTNSIAPWTSIFDLLAGAGAVVTSILTRLYHNWEPTTPASTQVLPHLTTLLVVVIFEEHKHFLLKFIADFVLDATWTDLQSLSARRREYEEAAWTWIAQVLEQTGVTAKVKEIVGNLEKSFGKLKEE